MRASQVLRKQNIGWHFKQHWAVQGVQKVQKTQAEKNLLERSIPVVDSDEFLVEKRERIKIQVIGFQSKPVAFDKTHPNWHERQLLTYRDDNVLVEGLAQAKHLTSTVEVTNGLPDHFELANAQGINSKVRQIIMSSHLFDAEQKKLPKVKDPERPAWNFPRTYGITQDRRTRTLLLNLLQLIENLSAEEKVRDRYIADDLLFSYNFEKYNQLIQFELTGDSLLTSNKPLKAITNQSTSNLDLPDLNPVLPTASLVPEHIYETRQIYPINLAISKSHPHTVFIHHDEEKVRNIYEEEVTEDQVFGRSLLKTFTVAASYAKNKYGEGVKVLPEPVVVQCVHTNSRLFHFGMFQLNTLDLENPTKNIWYQTGQIPLYTSCSYKLGKPTLEGYNSAVIKHLKAFYDH